jgi:hypothetical protein
MLDRKEAGQVPEPIGTLWNTEYSFFLTEFVTWSTILFYWAIPASNFLNYDFIKNLLASNIF